MDRDKDREGERALRERLEALEGLEGEALMAELERLSDVLTGPRLTEAAEGEE